MTTSSEPPRIDAKFVGRMVRTMRKRLGLSLREGADAVECSHVFLDAIECGRSALPVKRARRFASAFEMDFAELRQRATEAEANAAIAKIRKRWESA